MKNTHLPLTFWKLRHCLRKLSILPLITSPTQMSTVFFLRVLLSFCFLLLSPLSLLGQSGNFPLKFGHTTNSTVYVNSAEYEIMYVWTVPPTNIEYRIKTHTRKEHRYLRGSVSIFIPTSSGTANHSTNFKGGLQTWVFDNVPTN